MTFGEFVIYTWALGVLFTVGGACAIKDKKLNFGEIIFIVFMWPACMGIGLVLLMDSVR